MILSSFYLISSISKISKKFRFTGLFAGSVLFAIVITFPELSNNIIASLYNIESLGIGNLIGLILIDNLLFLGLFNIFTKSKFGKEGNFYIGYFMFSTLILILLSLDGIISREDGAILISIFLPYLFILLSSIKNVKIKKLPPIYTFVYMFLSIFVIVLSSWMLVSTSSFISKELNWMLDIFGITILAFITAFPEFSSGIVSILESKRERNVVLGGVYGANMINLVLIPGIASLIKPFHMTMTIMGSLLFILIVFAYIYFSQFLKRETSLEFGLSLISMYILYILLLIFPKI